MAKPPNKYAKRGRPKNPINDAAPPEKPLAPKAPKAPSPPKPPTSELPKEIIGSHMGYVQTGGAPHPTLKGTSSLVGPAIPRPTKLPKRGQIAPSFKK